jgi:hypothetical protein
MKAYVNLYYIAAFFVKFSDKSSREHQNIYFVCSFFFRKSCLFLDNVDKYGREGKATDESIMLRRKDAIFMLNGSPRQEQSHIDYV